MEVIRQVHVPAYLSQRKEPQSKKGDKVVPIHTKKAYRRRSGRAPLILSPYPANVENMVSS